MILKWRRMFLEASIWSKTFSCSQTNALRESCKRLRMNSRKTSRSSDTRQEYPSGSTSKMINRRIKEMGIARMLTDLVKRLLTMKILFHRTQRLINRYQLVSPNKSLETKCWSLSDLSTIAWAQTRGLCSVKDSEMQRTWGTSLSMLVICIKMTIYEDCCKAWPLMLPRKSS